MKRGLLALAFSTVLLASHAVADAPEAEPAPEPEVGAFGLSEAPPWSEARERLLVDVRALDEKQAPNAIFRQDIPYTRTSLILTPEKLGGDIYDVTLADALAWNKTGEALFEIALENLVRKHPPIVRETLINGVSITLLYSNEPYGASYAVEVESNSRCTGKKGALVAIPTPYATLCYPVDSKLAGVAYDAIQDLAVGVVQTGDVPLAPFVFWVYRDHWDTQPLAVREGTLLSSPSVAFQRVLKELEREAANPRNRRW
ncbi:MAG: hypothetical protein JRH10_15075 [Deltaproteobacteria bacterium]|nr:hypothetical protein [Deltaproteobacteria bacterium]MBW2448455.1 hypothetical protein [Deltaproteobacteria bacterium]